MGTKERKYLVVEPLEDCPPEIGCALWQLQDSRRRTREWLNTVKFKPAVIDWQPGAGMNSIGTLLYHIAAIEIDWLYSDILQQEWTPEITHLFPFDVRDSEGRLTVVKDLSMEAHLARLDRVREIFIEALRGLSIEDYRRPRSLPEYDVTPEWVMHHLAQHESEHRGEMKTVHALANLQAHLP